MSTNKTYQEKLRDPRWKKKRSEILARDKNQCQHCGSMAKPLHVHHKQYFSGLAPWEYENRYLITLCKYCHEMVSGKFNPGFTKLSKVIPKVLAEIHHHYTKLGIKLDE